MERADEICGRQGVVAGASSSDKTTATGASADGLVYGRRGGPAALHRELMQFIT